MTEKEIIKQLNNLKAVRPDSGWKGRNREILCNQIDLYNQEAQAENYSIFTLPIRLLRSIPQPILAAFLIVAFMLGSGVAGIYASKDSKPGDSLYIAKIVNEKTQQVLTFDERKKAQLGIEFAGNRYRELSQILAGKEEDEASKQEKVEKLVTNFKREISEARDRIARISFSRESQDRPDLKKPDDGASEQADREETAEEEAAMFSAGLGKDDKNIEIYDPEQESADSESGAEAEGAEEIVVLEEDPNAEETSSTEAALDGEPNASTTDEITEPEKDETGSTEEILNQANLLLESEDYAGSIGKLDEADESIDLLDEGQVKGKSESSTSTPVAEEEAGTGETENSATSTE